MPATTRSRTQTQTTLEDKGVSSSQSSSTKKRKAVETKPSPAKKQKTAPKPNPTKQEEAEKDSETILINRAPVLELWSSCVTHFLHPSLPWTTCLSVGGAISTITAISKGRSIGKVDKPDPGKAQEKREKRSEEQAELEEVAVMSFDLKLKDGAAMVGDKPKKGNEEALRKKFGEEDYDKAKKVFEESLEKWKGKEEELDGRAFHMYEDFRPSVAAGQKGWGRKGQLSLDTIRSVVRNE